MTWKLFLDDIRKPPKDENFIVARNIKEALSLITKKGFPSFISFDHDLGENELTGKDFISIIETKVLNKEINIPKNFQYNIHSDNLVGAENIRVHLNNLLKFKNIDFQLKKSKPHSFI